MPTFENKPENSIKGINITGASWTAVSAYEKTLERKYPNEEAELTSNAEVKKKKKNCLAVTTVPMPK